MDSHTTAIAWACILSFAPAAIIAGTVLFPIRRIAIRKAFVDQPGARKVHQQATPLGGGIGIWLGIVGTFAAGTLVVAILQNFAGIAESVPPLLLNLSAQTWARCGELWGLLGGASVLVLLGLCDDRYGLSPVVRLVVQTLVAAATVWGFGYQLTAYIPAAWLTKLLSVVWIVGVINAFNMLDNMDGLSGGVAAIVSLMLATILLLTPDPGTGQPQLLVASLLLVVSGGLVGFLLHNGPPAKIFMGDAGSYLVGFLIATSTLLATYVGYRETERPHAVFAPLCVMAVPLYDMITVLWIRIREKRNPFVGDKSHFSHRLVDLGLGKGQAVLTIYLLTTTCGFAGLLLGQVTPGGAILVGNIVVSVLVLIAILESTGWRKDNR